MIRIKQVKISELVEKVMVAKSEGLQKDVSDCLNGVETEGTGKFQFYQPTYQDDYCMLNPETTECPLQEQGLSKGMCLCAGGQYRRDLTNTIMEGWSAWGIIYNDTERQK